MKRMHAVLGALVLLSGCGTAAHRTQKEDTAPHDLSAASESRQARIRSLAAAALDFEPLGCPIYGGEDRPDYDAQGLHCLVEWLRDAQDYLDKGGKPTPHTNAESIKMNRALARKLSARVQKHLSAAAASPKPSAPQPVPRAEPSGPRTSQQRYLEGLVLFQQGHYKIARAVWTEALRLDPANADAKEALAMLDKLDAPER